MKVTAHANSNIGLIKYWGKKDPVLFTPNNSSLSMTFDTYGSLTTVDFSPSYPRDSFILDNTKYSTGEEYEQVTRQLVVLRQAAGSSLYAKVVSVNEVPTAAGIASSASGAAALAAAGAKALGLNLNPIELSILARQGSGSATRCVYGGFVEWVKGEKEDGSDSVAKQIVDENYWPDFRMIAAIVTTKTKAVKSRAGMAQTVATCPYYSAWVESIPEEIKNITQAIINRDFTKVGEISEHNCLKLHALMMTTKPALIYWMPETLQVIHSVMKWRSEGLECYFTIDAGPLVKVMCLEKDLNTLQQKIKELPGVLETKVLKPGKGIEYSENHLF